VRPAVGERRSEHADVRRRGSPEATGTEAAKAVGCAICSNGNNLPPGCDRNPERVEQMFSRFASQVGGELRIGRRCHEFAEVLAKALVRVAVAAHIRRVVHCDAPTKAEGRSPGLPTFGPRILTHLGIRMVRPGETVDMGSDVGRNRDRVADQESQTSSSTRSQFSPMILRTFCSDHPARCIAAVRLGNSPMRWTPLGFEISSNRVSLRA